MSVSPSLVRQVCRKDSIPVSSTSPPVTTQIKCSVWNVSGLGNKLGNNLIANIMFHLDLDILCVCETFLRNNDCPPSNHNYIWFGSNRKLLSKKATRGSGGVGVFINQSLLRSFNVNVLDNSVDDILWLSFTSITKCLLTLSCVLATFRQ